MLSWYVANVFPEWLWNSPSRPYYYWYRLVLLLLLLLLLLLQFSCHSVAEVLTLVQTKQIGINVHKRNNTKNTVQTIQNTVNTSRHITKNTHTLQTPHIYTPTIRKEVKSTTVQHTPKWNGHTTVKYPQYKVTLMYMVLSSPRTST